MVGGEIKTLQPLLDFIPFYAPLGEFAKLQ
jgi:hypothetical protein